MNHPYKEFEETMLWKTIKDGIVELERNRDVELTTAREYVVGFLCQKLIAQGLVLELLSVEDELRKQAD